MKKIGEILVEMGLVTEEDIEEAMAYKEKHGGLLGEILTDALEYITKEDLMFALGAQSEMEVIDLDAITIPGEIISRVPLNIAESFQVIPIAFDDDVLTLALADPLNPTILDDLKFLLNCELRGAVSDPVSVQRAIDVYYEHGDDIDDLLEGANFGADDLIEIEDDNKAYNIDDLQRQANQPAVVKLLNVILLEAIKAHAADIHLEPFEDEFKVRYRVDGILYEMKAPPLSLASALISRVKVMADLDISERRLPQDGRIELNIGGRPVDIRVSTLPVIFGEACVMRILDRSTVSLDMENIGFLPRDLEVIKQIIEKPNGIILVTGPTGSGKTTTLYACLNTANTPERKIITTEDPVEYDLYGIVQVQVNPDSGLTYAASLRSILRQDPDMVLVGEIRDLETAKIAVESALTGHVVLSTLHTNDAPSVVTRLVDLGVEPFLLAATLEGIIAQRLVRTVCAGCRRPYKPNVEELADLQLTPEMIKGKKLYFGDGCDVCNNTGYKGRMGIFEIMLGTESVKQLIMEEAPVFEIAKAARADGMRTLREAGVQAVYSGKTTVEEVVKETVNH